MTFALATAAHEPQLRSLAREYPMPGWIRLAFTFEPDWFAGHAMLGHRVQTIVAQDPSGRAVGCGVRAVRRVFVKGTEADIGYLGGLRFVQAVRRSGALAHGYRFLHRLHDEDGLVPAYLTTIVEENTEAAALLTSGRAGLPAYLDRGRYITSAISLGRRRVRPPPDGLTILTGAGFPLDDILHFLSAEGRKRQFFPVLDRAGLESLRLSGFNPADFRIALTGRDIRGVTAVWDQRAVRQSVVTGYPPALLWARPLLNAGLGLAGRRPLPAPGESLDVLHTSFTCIRDDDPSVLRALLDRIHTDYASSPFHYFVVGLHERDPLRAALTPFPVLNYASRLYLVCWEDGRPFCDALDCRLIPHLETAML
jgi:hypothetical protein